MKNHEEYQNAMGRIAPSQEWKTDTLQKMRRIRQQTNDPQKVHPSIRQRWIPVAAAAAVAVLLVPGAVHLSRGVPLEGGQAGARAVQETAEVQPQDLCRESAPMKEDRVNDENGSKMGENTEDMVHGLPVLTWEDQTESDGGKKTVLAKNPADLEDGNPTYNLPQDQLPQALPVWYAPCGPEYGKALLEQMQKTAESMNLLMQAEPIEERPNGVPESCWPFAVRGVLLDTDGDPSLAADLQPEKIRWKLEANGAQVALTKQKATLTVENAVEEYRSAALSKEADAQAVQQFGELAGIHNPVHSSTPVVNPDGSIGYPGFSHFYYEAESQASIETKLKDYCFKRVSGSANQDGELHTVLLTMPPNTPQAGVYPLRSLQEAKDALDKMIQADRKNGVLDYELSTQDLVSWKLEYDQYWTNPWIQPIYVFTLEVPMTPKQMQYEFAGSEAYHVYVNYRVSAVRPEYLAP